MCGIAGVVSPARGEYAQSQQAAVRRMLEAQGHRGPDDHGLLPFPGAVLGHRRLSILDLSGAARQPLCNETGTVWVTYNGEIYNYAALRSELVSRGHRFECQADTEVLVHGYEEWGIAGLLERIDGMFAFCLWDAPRRTALLARDRLGIKPLYYSWDGERLVFASEVKAIAAGGLVPQLDRDPDALAGFLAFGSIPQPATQYRQVRCAPPGAYLELSVGGLSERRYWAIPEDGARRDSAPMAELLRDSVRRHMVADVPTGVFLSGGIDSAALVSLAREAGVKQLTALTVAFDEQAFNEADAAAAVAARFGATHRRRLVREADFVENLPRLFAAMDQPSIDGANSYFVSWMAREAGVKVALSGLGADEVFWGYRYYRWLTRYRSLFDLLARGPAAIQALAERSLRAVGAITGQDRWMRFLAAPGNFAGALYGFLRGFLSPRSIAALLQLDDSGARRMLEKHWLSPAAGTGSPARMFNRMEMSRYLHDTLLRDTDVFSMAHSIEVRVPFLDRAVIEAAAVAPDSAKVHGSVNKPLLVNAVSALPVERHWRAKKGFVFPISEWMRRNREPFEAYVKRVDCLDPHVVRRLWDGFLAGQTHWSRAWGMVALGARFQP